MFDVAKIVKKAILESEEQPLTESFMISEIERYLSEFDNLDINTFQYHEDIYKMNPYFGYRENAYPRGIHSIWMAAGYDRITVEILPRGYGSKEERIEGRNFNRKQLTGVYYYIKSLYERRLKELEEDGQNKSLDELLPEIGEFAQRCVDTLKANFKTEIKYGRRQSVSYSYYSIIVSRGKDDYGYIRLIQDNFGALKYNVLIPGCGEYAKDIKFKYENMEDVIKEAISEIVGKKIVL